MSTSDRHPDAVGDYDPVAAWSVGPENTPDAERIIVSGGRAALLSSDGAESLPAVEWCLPETPRSPARVDHVEPDVAEAFARHLMMAARAAREATP